ncbi:MAG: RHS repeat-associated core domain-containing protein, partial [Phycisphaerae bacterium]|nr:RHS repeat-associated core domain-containing protein [Phycisphaerae bacterium]
SKNRRKAPAAAGRLRDGGTKARRHEGEDVGSGRRRLLETLAGTALRWFVHGESFPEPLAMVDLSAAGDNSTPGVEEFLYYLTDAQGSVGALTNAIGQVVERYFYTPYGETTITAADGTTPRTESLYGNPFAYTAHRYEPQTGLYHFWARAYSPTLGRFLQEDMQGPLAVVDVLFRSNGHHPLIMSPFAGASPEYRDTLNLFLYALASPAVHQDPFGLSVALWVAEKFLDATGGDDSWLDDQEFVQKLSMGFGIAGVAALGGAFIIAAAPAIVTAAQSLQMAIATASGGGGAALLSRWPGPAGGRQIASSFL